MSNTGATAVLLPVVVSLAWNAKTSASKLLIPLAFGSSIGGMLTLIGTPPNIVVSKQLEAEGLAAFSFFDFVPIGLVVLAVSVVYMLTIGRRLLPDRKISGGQEDGTDTPSMMDLAAEYALPNNLYRLRVRRNAHFVGRTIGETQMRTRYGVTVLEVQSWPDGEDQPLPRHPAEIDTVLDVHDILYVQGSEVDVARLAREENLGVRPADEGGDRLLGQELGMVEVLLTPASRLVGRTLSEFRFRNVYGLNVLGMKRMGKPFTGDLPNERLRFGDTLLLEGPWEQIELLRQERRNLVVVGQPKEMAERRVATDKAPWAVLIMIVMLVLMTTGVVPTVTAVLLAAVAMVLTGCLSMEAVYRTMSWESVILIAAMLPMATALQKTGGVEFIANGLTSSLGGYGPLAVMAGVFVLTTVFSQFISNTATTVLVAPIAFQAAVTLGVSPQAYLMAVAVAASAAFSTPIASPVNTLVLSPGGYRFSDFVKVGVPLQIVVMIAALLTLPLFFPL
jgi:di/tricarboxylate transporter